jgi:anti-sigma factor RsiW
MRNVPSFSKVCPEYQSLIAELAEGQISGAERQRVEMHLERCPGCQAYHNGLLALDQELAAGIRLPALPLDFRQSLLVRIHQETAPSQCLDAGTLLVSSRNDILRRWFPNALDLAAYVGLALPLAFGLKFWIEDAVHWLPQVAGWNLSRGALLVSAMVTGSVALAGGCWLAWKELRSQSEPL